MLEELYVENFALIEKLRLSLTAGLNALTGETGAGKSLVVDTVALLIGGRAKDNLIRSGCDRCYIEGLFSPPFSRQIEEQLTETGIETEDNLILCRELIRGGRSICRINGRTVSAGILRQVGRLLINIHGQMEHMLLLEDEQQLQLLDSFGGEEELTKSAEVAVSYHQWQQYQQQLNEYHDNKEQRSKRRQLLAFEIKEIEDASLTVDEEQNLKDESLRLANAERLLAFTADTCRLIAEDRGISEQLSQAVTALNKTAEIDKKAMELSQRLSSLYYEVEDISREVAAYRDSLDVNNYRLEDVESRLALLGRFKSKYGGSIEAVLNYCLQAKEELAALEEIDYSGQHLETQLTKAKEAYRQTAEQLHIFRRQAADKLAAAVTKELHLLCMEQADFRVDLQPVEPGINGNEKAVFMIETNRGEGFKPVAAIASGGELSRIVLGIKVILAQLDQVPTLVFDEVDSGLGGVALNAVAERMAVVAKTAQAICVTHAAPMAAVADHHLHISKMLQNNRTVITVENLQGKRRIDEIARMIAGDKVSDTTLQQAEELLMHSK